MTKRRGLALPLNAFYSATALSRRAPAWKIALWTALPIMCLVALAIALVWRDPLLVSDHTWHGTRFLILVLLPLLLLVMELGLLWWLMRFKHRDIQPNGALANNPDKS